MRKNSLIAGTLILTLAGFITRILGFVYRIYISNLIGSEGMGLFQLIFPIFMLAHTICSSGSFIAISKIVAEENAKKAFGNMRRALRFGVFLSLATSILVAFSLSAFAPVISIRILGDERTLLAVRFLAILVPFSVMNSCFKAYFYGTKEMYVPATSQVLEQVARMTVIFFIAGFFVPLGLSYACLMAIIGSAVGELVSLLHVYISYRFHCHKKIKSAYKKKPSIRYRNLATAVFAIIIPLTSSRTITTLLMSYEHIIIPSKLMQFGLTNSSAMSLYGELTGMALPLIMFPSLLTNALSMSLLPTISEASAIKNHKKINFTISKALQFTALIGVGSTSIFLTLPHELGITVYNQANVGVLLASLAFICPFIYIQSTFGGILNGLGLQKTAFKNNLIGAALRISIIFFAVPSYGLKAYFVGLTLSLIVVSTLNISKVLRMATITFDTINWLVKPILAASLAGIGINYVAKHAIYNHFSLPISLIMSILLLGFIYIGFILIFGCIKREDIRNLKDSL